MRPNINMEDEDSDSDPDIRLGQEQEEQRHEPTIASWSRLWAGWDFIWQRGSAADRNILKLNQNIGRK